MERDRSFLSDLFGAALRGDGGAVQRMAVRYASEHGHGGGGGEGGEVGDDGGDDESVVVTPPRRAGPVQGREGEDGTPLRLSERAAAEAEEGGAAAEQRRRAASPEEEGGPDDGGDGSPSHVNGEEDESDDIVHQLLLSDWAEENHILTDPPPDADGGGGGTATEAATEATGIGILRAKDGDGLTPLMLASQLSRRSKSLSDPASAPSSGRRRLPNFFGLRLR